MSGRKKLNGKRLKTDLYQHSLTYITMLFGFTVTFVITVINCLVTLFIENNLQFEDVVKPLSYGVIITPLLALLLNKYFSEVEQARSKVEDLQKQETQLKTSLTKTYIAMINQREKNNTLFREHEKLQRLYDRVVNEVRALRQENVYLSKENDRLEGVERDFERVREVLGDEVINGAIWDTQYEARAEFLQNRGKKAQRDQLGL